MILFRDRAETLAAESNNASSVEAKNRRISVHIRVREKYIQKAEETIGVILQVLKRSRRQSEKRKGGCGQGRIRPFGEDEVRS